MPPKKKVRREPDGVALSSAILDAVTCPITSELVVCPVVAADGHVYERDAIAKWLSTKKTSPRTNKAMSSQLFGSPARSMVTTLMEAGGVDDDAAVGAWHIASARAMIRGALPGGLELARDHLRRGVAHGSAEGTLLLDAFDLRDKGKELVARADVGARGDLELILGLGPKPLEPMKEYLGSTQLVPESAVIRIVDNAAYLKFLCKRPAPGAEEAVKYNDAMAGLCGREFVVNSFSSGARKAYSIKDGDRTWIVPFDACILIRES